jgi:hypothetical protein
MKYFTPAILNRIRSEHEDVSEEAHDEWDRATERYRRRVRRILPAMPEGTRRFKANHICLHDADVPSMGRTGDTFVILLETEPPASKPVVLTFTPRGEPAIETDTLIGSRASGPFHWMYEEWDLDRDKRPTFEVLFSNGWLVKLPFRAFHDLIAEPVAPSLNGMVTRPAGETAVSGPARA